MVQTPLPVANFRQVLTVLVDVPLVFDQLFLEPPLQGDAFVARLWHSVDGVHDEVVRLTNGRPFSAPNQDCPPGSLPGGHSLAASELMSWVVTSIEQAEDSRELRKLGSPTKLSSTNRCHVSRAIHVL
jgi:hypothetical protein